MQVLVGCCGFPGGMKWYFKNFDVVETQSTFYRLPRQETAAKWREMAPPNFEFCVKAFQGITHPASSPTWRRAGMKPKAGHGFLKPSKEVSDAWTDTLAFCVLLRASVCLIQTPSSFRESKENVRNAVSFLSEAKREAKARGVLLAFEPRGWCQETVRKVCQKSDVTHCCDPFAVLPTYLGKERVAYFRLHGKPPGKQLYRYRYTKADLKKLLATVKSLEAKKCYVLFNNIFMGQDSKAFLKLLR